MGYALCSTFQFAALMSWLSGSPFAFIEGYGVSPRAFGLVPTDANGRVTQFLEKPQTPEEIVTDPN